MNAFANLMSTGLFVLVLAGCSGNNLNEEAAAAAINKDIRGISCIPVGDFRNSQSGELGGPYRVYTSVANSSKAIKAMYDAGIIEVVENQYSFVVFSIKQQFLEHFRDDRINPIVAKIAREGLHVCAQGESVESISNFTVPGENGPQISQVEFHWGFSENIPDEWSGAFPDLANSYSGFGTATIQLTNNGWEVVDLQRTDFHYGH